jgi:hypothetical protein
LRRLFVEFGSKGLQTLPPAAPNARLKPLLLTAFVQMSELDMSQAAEKTVQGILFPGNTAGAATDGIRVDLDLIRAVVEEAHANRHPLMPLAFLRRRCSPNEYLGYPIALPYLLPLRLRQGAERFHVALPCYFTLAI